MATLDNTVPDDTDSKSSKPNLTELASTFQDEKEQSHYSETLSFLKYHWARF